MKIDYHLDEDDFLTHQLFIASRSPRIQSKRKRSRISVPIVYSIIGILFLFQEQFGLTVVFGLLGLLWYVFYPKWDKNRFVKHYQKFIEETYKERLGVGVSLEIGNEYMWARDKANESKIAISELTEICEISSTIYLLLRSGQTLILPKNKIKDLDSLTKTLRELADRLAISYTVNHHWSWR